MTILLLALLFLLLWPVIKIGYKIYRAQRQMRKAFEQASQQQQKQEADREKIFDRNVGEYVDFEEIRASLHPNGKNRATNRRCRVGRHQITQPHSLPRHINSHDTVLYPPTF